MAFPARKTTVARAASPQMHRMNRAGGPRPHQSKRRRQATDDSGRRILDASRSLFSRDGVDCVTAEKIAGRAKVAKSTTYALRSSDSWRVMGRRAGEVRHDAAKDIHYGERRGGQDDAGARARTTTCVSRLRPRSDRLEARMEKNPRSGERRAHRATRF
ncbi:MAG: hypothetical protein C3F11_16595 [Methylocystaceae bacterium]|nr:MAG: hypothetical protein C3F11_16595 [Methylocystaceae bacterium]